VAAPIEKLTGSAAGALVRHLLRTALPGPYKFEADANPAVEITVYRQEKDQRLLVGLLNMQEDVPAVPVDATVRVQIPMAVKRNGCFDCRIRKRWLSPRPAVCAISHSRV